MATLWNFTANGSSLIKTLDETDPVVSPRSQSFVSPSIRMVGTVIYIYEGGNYATCVMFSQIGEIDGVAPTDLQDAYNKLIALIPTGGGSAGSNYNEATAYDTVADLPITFPTGTIHSISILCITGELTISISGEETVLIAGQNTDIEATTLIVEDIVIESCTGTFLATTLS